MTEEVHAKVAVRNQLAIASSMEADRARVDDIISRIQKIERDVALIGIKLSQMQKSYVDAMSVLGKGPTER